MAAKDGNRRSHTGTLPRQLDTNRKTEQQGKPQVRRVVATAEAWLDRETGSSLETSARTWLAKSNGE